MDTFAALALATDPPTPSVLDRKPDPKSSRLITLNMWKMIIGQSIYQLIVTLVLDFRGNEILGYTTEFEKIRLETLVFNIYVWMQVFNQLYESPLFLHISIRIFSIDPSKTSTKTLLTFSGTIADSITN
jgi:Ca2+-transporting ATPase